MKYIKEGGSDSTGTRKKSKLNWKYMVVSTLYELEISYLVKKIIVILTNAAKCKFQSPQQKEGWECAYYTMIFMFDFVERIQFEFPKAVCTSYEFPI